MKIRPAANEDALAIKSLCLDAFPDSENKVVADLAVALLAEPSAHAFIAYRDSMPVGYICFSPMAAKNAPSTFTLSPLAVSTNQQKQGIGTKLIRHGAKALTKMGVQVLTVYGDPKYYSRFGFSVEIGEKFLPTHKMQYPFGWQGLYLNDTEAPTEPIYLTCVEALNNPDLW